jgi:hypothetical protein
MPEKTFGEYLKAYRARKKAKPRHVRTPMERSWLMSRVDEFKGIDLD